jgi:hypothetical protein
MNYIRTLENLEAFLSDSENYRTRAISQNSTITNYRRQQKRLVLVIVSFFLLFVTGAGCIIGLTPQDTPHTSLCTSKVSASHHTNFTSANITHPLLVC